MRYVIEKKKHQLRCNSEISAIAVHCSNAVGAIAFTAAAARFSAAAVNAPITEQYYEQ